jgi:hypothetical protein
VGKFVGKNFETPNCFRSGETTRSSLVAHVRKLHHNSVRVTHVHLIAVFQSRTGLRHCLLETGEHPLSVVILDPKAIVVEARTTRFRRVKT